MDGYTRVLIRVFSVLSCDGVFLLRHGLSRVEAAVLENNCSVAEYEIHGTVNVTFAVELTIRMCIHCVLVSDDVASVDHRVV